MYGETKCRKFAVNEIICGEENHFGNILTDTAICTLWKILCLLIVAQLLYSYIIRNLVYQILEVLHNIVYHEGITLILFYSCYLIIGASLSEPHTSEFNGAIFIYIYIYISVVRRSVNASSHSFNPKHCTRRVEK